MSNSQRNLRQLELLKEIGVSIAMDDFGTGYSSLGYLWKFPFDKIKIDKSFLGGMENVDEKANQIVSTIIALGHTLEMCVTAEGVETEAQAEFLNAHKCDQLQGFLLGRPMPAEEIDKFIIDGKSKKKLIYKLSARLDCVGFCYSTQGQIDPPTIRKMRPIFKQVGRTLEYFVDAMIGKTRFLFQDQHITRTNFNWKGFAAAFGSPQPKTCTIA